MANVKISQLPALTSITGTDVLPIVSGNTTYNVTAANIANYVGNTAVATSIAYGISNVIIPIADGNVQINAGVSGWTFTDTGAIVLPSGGTEIQADRILGQVNENFQITIQDQDNDGWTFQTTVIDGLGNTYSQTALERDTFRIYTNLAATSHQWSFDNSGRFNLPGNIQGNYGSDVSLYILNGLGVGNVEMKTVNYSNDTLLSNVTVKDNTVTISTNNSGNTWTFDNSGVLTLPGEGVVRSNNDTLILQSYNTGTSTGNGIRIGTSGGLFFENGSNPAYLNILESANNAVMTATANLQIVADGTNTAQTWNFDTTGSLHLPGGTGAIESFANNVSIYSDAAQTNGVVLYDTGIEMYGINDVSIYADNGNLTWTFDNTGNLIAPGNINATGNITAANLGNVSAINLNGNTSTVLSGDGSWIAQSGGSYGDSNVVTLLSSYGSNTVSTTGNVTTGNLAVAGEIVGTYTPSTTIGAGILAQGANTQGGTGYFDFLKVTNQSGGANNASKSLRLSNIGTLEVINSAYSATLLTLTDSGNLTVPGNATISGTSSNVTRRAFGLVAADVNVTLDDLSANVTSSTSQLALSTTGGWQGTGWTETFTSGTPSVSNWVNLPLSSGFTSASGAMNSQGQGCRCVISDQTPSAKVYQITAVRSGTSGALWNISIERLV